MSDQLSDRRKKKLTKAEEAQAAKMMLFSSPQSAQLERLISVGCDAMGRKLYVEIAGDLEAMAAKIAAEHRKIFELQEAAFQAVVNQLHLRLVELERMTHNYYRPFTAERNGGETIVTYQGLNYVPPEPPQIRAALEALLAEPKVEVSDPEPVLMCSACGKEPSGWKTSSPPFCVDCGHHVTAQEDFDYRIVHDPWMMRHGSMEADCAVQPEDNPSLVSQPLPEPTGAANNEVTSAG